MRIETTRSGGGGGRGIRRETSGGSVISLWPQEGQSTEATPRSPQKENGFKAKPEAPESRARRLRARLVRREAALRPDRTEVQASGLTHWSVPRPAPSPTVYASATPGAVRWDAVRK